MAHYVISVSLIGDYVYIKHSDIETFDELIYKYNIILRSGECYSNMIMLDKCDKIDVIHDYNPHYYEHIYDAVIKMLIDITFENIQKEVDINRLSDIADILLSSDSTKEMLCYAIEMLYWDDEEDGYEAQIMDLVTARFADL